MKRKAQPKPMAIRKRDLRRAFPARLHLEPALLIPLQLSAFALSLSVLRWSILP